MTRNDAKRRTTSGNADGVDGINIDANVHAVYGSAGYCRHAADGIGDNPASEGFAELIGDQLPAELFESVEDIVEAVVALCDCRADITGRVFSSLDMIDEWG